MISVIIPAYNSAATIVEALESVLAQSLWANETTDYRPQTTDRGMADTKESRVFSQSAVYGLRSEVSSASPLYEVIVVDDCSTDDTVAVVRRWIARLTSYHRLQTTNSNVGAAVPSGEEKSRTEDSPVGTPAPTFESNVYGLMSDVSSPPLWSVVSLRSNAGPAAARNAGIAAAKGDWIAFLDADDCWLPHRLAVQMACAAQDPGVALWCGEAVRFQAGSAKRDEGERDPLLPTMNQEPSTRNQAPSTKHTLRPITLEELAERNPIATSTVLVRKSILIDIGGFDPQFRGPEDYDLWLRIAARFPVRFVLCPLSAYRYQPGSLSTDDRRFLNQVVRVLRKAYGPGGALHKQPGFRRALSYHHLACAWMAIERGARGQAVRLWLESLLIWPWSCGGQYYPMPWARLRLLWYLLKKQMWSAAA